MENDNNIYQSFEKDFDLKSFFDKYLIHWKWFVFGVGICLITAFLYVRYTIPQYEASTKILVKDANRGSMLSELSAFSDMGVVDGVKSNVDNEIEILRSRTLVESTVKKLNLNVRIFAKGKIMDIELYKDAPIEVILISPENNFYDKGMNFTFTELTRDTFELKNDFDNEEPTAKTATNKFHYGQLIVTPYGHMIIRKSNIKSKNVENSLGQIGIVISSLEGTVSSFAGRLKVNPLNKVSSVVEITINDPVLKKAEDFLDNLVEIYNRKAVTDKNFIVENTYEFINNRLAIITHELEGVEKNVETFKTSNKVTDIVSEADLYVKGSDDYDKKGVETEIQLNMVSSMLSFLKKSNNTDLLPANIISTGQGDASNLISSYNDLVLERNRILRSATTENPSVIKLDQQISSLKSNVLASLLRMESNLTIQKENLKLNEGLLDSKIGMIPVQERQFKVIARQQKVKEELYLYLLQKREETAISLSTTEPNARVIDAGKANKFPVSPQKSAIYLAAFLLGLFIPFVSIYIIDLLDTKLKSRFDLDGKTKIPFIGDIPTSNSPSELMKPESRSSSAEALRMIKTNLEFILPKVTEGNAKSIFITSTFSKEGKSFVSANLAATFALSGKKVLLIGMDIRNPTLEEYFTLPNQGVSNFLASTDLKLDDLIVKQDGFENLYVLSAGAIPPNPTELFMRDRVDELFKTVKNQYDYVIVDSAPVSLVADTLLIAKHADCFIYVARANFLEKRLLSIPNNLYSENKLPNMCILLNDTDSAKGYGYGYGVHIEKGSWFKKRK